MNVQQLKSQIDAAPLADRATLDKLYLYMTVADLIKPEYADMLAQAESYQDFLNAVFMDESRKYTLEWAEIAKLKRRNWLSFFEPDILVQNLPSRWEAASCSPQRAAATTSPTSTSSRTARSTARPPSS